MTLYSISLVPPENLLNEVLEYQRQYSELFYKFPSSLHITLLYGDFNVRPEISPIDSDLWITSSSIDVFDNYALVLRLEKTPELSDLQRKVFEMFSDSDFEDYYVPKLWNPHITIGYTPLPRLINDPVEPITGRTSKLRIICEE